MAGRWGKRFLNKHPRNTLRIGFLDALFPDSRFIHLVRDGRGVIASLLKERGARDSRQVTPYGNFCKPIAWRDYLERPAVEQAARQWVDLVTYARRALAALGARRSLEIRYEDFCADPAAVLADCDRFCGLRPQGGHLLPTAGELGNRNHKWRAAFSTQDLDTIMEIGGPLLRELGYVIDAPAGLRAGDRELLEAGAI
jgi:hypothetical protein